MSKPAFKLTYFNLRWLGEPARFIFSYAGQEFEEVRIPYGDNWEPKDNYRYRKLPSLEVKQEDGSVVILSQSFAIIKYLGSRFGLGGKTLLEQASCDEIGDCIKDILNEIFALWDIWEKDDPQGKAKIKTKLVKEVIPRYFTHFNELLKKKQKLPNGLAPLVGNGLTWIDFVLAHWSESLELLMKMVPSGDGDKLLLDDYLLIREHQKAVFGLSEIKEWIAKRPKTDF